MYKLPIDKSLIMWYNWPGAHGQGARNFHYTILLAFCQVKSRIILYKYFIPNLCIIPSCNLVRSVVYYHCQGEIPLSHIYGVGLRLEVAIDLGAHKIAIGELHRNARGCKKISRVFLQKPLDKSLKV